MDWKSLVHNKKLWFGVAGAAGLGAVVFVRRNGIAPSGSPSGGANTSAAGGVTPVGSTGYVQGGADTTGTDIAGFLSQYSQSLDGRLVEWSGNLSDTLKAIQEGQANGQSGGQTTPGGWHGHHAGGGNDYQTINVREGQWVSDVLPSNQSFAQLLSANAGNDIFGKADAQGYISSSNPADPSTLQNVFTKAGTIKIQR